ncbi:MAG: HNH endonuclease signature motif containing protein, partial [Actinomycetota bacterium]
EFIRLRDRTCRTPWCDAPVRHVDHVRAHADGGPTTAANAQGLCEACNHAKAAPGWAATTTTSAQAGHTVTLTTPTGATYHSTAPPAPAPLPRGRPGRDRVDFSWVEWHLEVMLEHAS